MKYLKQLRVLILVISFVGSVLSVSDGKGTKNVNPINRPIYARNPAALKTLSMVEEIVVRSLRNMDNQKHHQGSGKCYAKLAVYLTKYNQDSAYLGGKVGMERADEVLDNGLLTVKMLHRVVNNLFPVTSANECTLVNKTIEGLFSMVNMTKPTLKDLGKAHEGILNIQFTYGFHASQMKLGIYGETSTGVKLDIDECLSLGKTAIIGEADVLAYQWLSVAAAHPVLSAEQRNELKAAWNALMILSNSTGFKEMKRKLDGKTLMTLWGHEPYTFNDYSTCRGISGTPKFPKQENLYCFYHDSFHPYLRINPVKTEVLSEAPIILQFYDIFDSSVMKFLEEFSEAESWLHNLQSPESKADAEKELPDCFKKFPRYLQYDREPIRIMKRRIEMVTGLKTPKETNSKAHLAHKVYGSLGGHYAIHHDSLETWKCNYSSHGNRIATVMINLSDVKMGGYTTFPHIGVFAKPVKGSVVFWLNLDRNGTKDSRTMHTGCPVILGEKRVVLTGMFQLNNMWTYPCVAGSDV